MTYRTGSFQFTEKNIKSPNQPDSQNSDQRESIYLVIGKNLRIEEKPEYETPVVVLINGN